MRQIEIVSAAKAMSDWAPFLDPNTLISIDLPKATVEFEDSHYEPVVCEVDISEDRHDILAWEEAEKELEVEFLKFNVDDVYEPDTAKLVKALATLRKGREPVASQELDRRISELLEQRRAEESDRVEHLKDKEFISKIQKKQKKAMTVRSFTTAELELLITKDKLQRDKENNARYFFVPNRTLVSHDTLSERLVSCQESASAMVILSAIKKRYKNPSVMHQSIYAPGGYMFKKYWNDLVDDVERLEGKKLTCEDSEKES